LLMQALNQSQQAVRLLHGLATGEGDTFQCMFLVRPPHFLNCGINRNFRAEKLMCRGVPALWTTD
jgi:hypothetical protein